MIEKQLAMIEPPIDALRKKIGNKFLLTCLISKRAKELNNVYLAGEPLDKDPKMIAIAAQEVIEGKVVPGKKFG